MRAGWRRFFRPAVAAPAWRNIAKTFAQAAVVWSLSLWLLPALIAAGVDAAAARGWSRPWLTWPPWPRTGWAMFLAASAAGLWSAVTMARFGEGTPLPLDRARKLVTAGPYGWIRNPMAVLGLAQGAGVALIFGSTAVAAYVAAGGLFWNFVLRPLEERDLVEAHGAPYERYRAAVPCWRPRLSRYDDGA
jgi:protein-S-isoprenylcysteine O-methyltransferase Ste14